MLLAELRQEHALLREGSIRCRPKNSEAVAVRSGAHEGLMCPLEKGVRGINKSSSDDRPGPCICDSKYVEDAKAARSVRVWDGVPMKT